MGLFGQSTPFDADVEKATSDTNTSDNWSVIMDVCDKVASNPRASKDCLKAIMKRMGHSDPHVVLQAITLLDACVNNCGKAFHLEIASREFENEYRRILDKAQPKVALKMRQVLISWAELFKKDRELNLIPTLMLKLKLNGHDFRNLNENPKPSDTLAGLPKDPNVVISQQEEEDLAKAIELSLKENKDSPKNSSLTSATSLAYPALYPSFSATGSLTSVNSNGHISMSYQSTEARKVRALYDFEAAEENEMTFSAGEIINVLDDSDPNWWKGYNQRGEGLFPSNFVSADLSVDPERIDITKKFANDNYAKTENSEEEASGTSQESVQVDEAKIDRLLHLLHEANPEDPSQDSEEMLRLESDVHKMGPLIDSELEKVDGKHAQLTQLSSDLVDAINFYHSLMANDRVALENSSSSSMGSLPALSAGNTNYPFTGLGTNHILFGNNTFSLSLVPSTPQLGAGAFCALKSLPYNPAMQSTGPTNINNIALGSAPNQLSHFLPGSQIPLPMQFRNGNVATTVDGQLMKGVTQQPNAVMGLPTADSQQALNLVSNMPPYQHMPQQAHFLSQHSQQPHQQQRKQQAITQPNQSAYVANQPPQTVHQQYNNLSNRQPYMVPPSALQMVCGTTPVNLSSINSYSHDQISQQQIASMSVGMPRSQHFQQLTNESNAPPQSVANISIHQQEP